MVERDDKLFLAYLEASSQRDKQLNSPPYDGVYGQLPAWVPDWHKNEFNKIRNRLLDTPLYGESISSEKIIQWMDNYCRLAEAPGMDGYIPEIVWDAIAYLAHIRYAVSLEEKEGLALLAGEGAVKGLAFSSGGTTKKGKEYEPKASIRKICDKIKSTNAKDVLKAVRNAGLCSDWYESTVEPIGVFFTGVDDNNVISYLKRGASPKNPKKISYKTLGGYLTAINKSK